LRQYKKNKGRKVLVITNEDAEKEGVLLEVNDQAITLEWTAGKGKKAVQEQVQIPYENIKSTIVQVQF
jgi:ribosome maturation factor RimP